jgi:hypothetical protein
MPIGNFNFATAKNFIFEWDSSALYTAMLLTGKTMPWLLLGGHGGQVEKTFAAGNRQNRQSELH